MYYGFDVGGTKIEFGAFNKDLELVATERILTPTDDYSQFLQSIVQLVEKYDTQLKCKGHIGIGIPGIEEAETGRLLTANIACAKDKCLREDLQSTLDRTVKIENDANCFALSEAWDKELQGTPSVLGVILGTGVGAGLVIHGHVFSGLNRVAGELGHTRLPIDAWKLLGESVPYFECGCGQKGCVENYISGRGFEQVYMHLHGEEQSVTQIIDDYRMGKKQATEFVDMYMELIAICFSGFCTALDPHVIVLGGGLSNFDLIYKELPKRLPKYLLSIAKAPRIIQAKYGDSGGVRGAAFLHLDKCF